MIDVTFLPKKFAPGLKPVTYHVVAWNSSDAERKARIVFKEDLGIKVAHYELVVFAETRIIR